MTSHQQAQISSACRCSQCGGSGKLRVADQRYRTCLDCLGQGQVVLAAGAITTAELLQRRSNVSFSLSVSSVAR